MKVPENNIDPDVKIPAAVRAAAARADEALNTLVRGTNPTETPPAEESVDPNASDVTDDSGGGVNGGTEGEPKATEPGDQGQGEGTQTGEARPEKRPTKDAKVTQEGNLTQDDWKHRYESMKGRYDRLRVQMQSMSDEIANLQNVIASLQVQKQDNPGTKEQPARLITDREVEEYGQEFLEVVGKKAREELAAEIVELRQTVKNLQEKLGQVGGYVASTARQRMLAELDQSIPEWRELNEDPNFLAWLRLPDTYSGAIRHELLKAAYERNDTARVKAFFKGFLAEEAAVAPRSTDPDRTQTNQSGNKVPLEAFAAPGRAKSAAATAPAEKQVFTRAQIAQFYRDVAAGKYSGREKEKERLERQIFEASREGRLVG